MSEPGRNGALLEVRDLKTYFYRRGRFGVVRQDDYVPAVDGVSFSVREGETLGIVGESGCGKTTLGRTILRLAPATSGSVLYRGEEILELSPSVMRERRREMQMIFQDLDAALNPKMKVSELLGEALSLHQSLSPHELRRRSEELLALVALAGQALRPSTRSLRRGKTPGLHRRAGGQPDARASRRARPDLSVHLPRPPDGGAHRRAGDGNVSGAGRGDGTRHDTGGLSRPSVFKALVVSGQRAHRPSHRGQWRRRLGALRARTPQGGLPVPGPLCRLPGTGRARPVPRERLRAPAHRAHPRPPGGLSLSAGRIVRRAVEDPLRRPRFVCSGTPTLPPGSIVDTRRQRLLSFVKTRPSLKRLLRHRARSSAHRSLQRHVPPDVCLGIQQLREAFPYDTAPRYLIFDRDSIFSAAVIEFFKAMGTKPVRTSFRSPWQKRNRGALDRQLASRAPRPRRHPQRAPSRSTRARIHQLLPRGSWAVRARKRHAGRETRHVATVTSGEGRRAAEGGWSSPSVRMAGSCVATFPAASGAPILDIPAPESVTRLIPSPSRRRRPRFSRRFPLRVAVRADRIHNDEAQAPAEFLHPTGKVTPNLHDVRFFFPLEMKFCSTPVAPLAPAFPGGEALWPINALQSVLGPDVVR